MTGRQKVLKAVYPLWIWFTKLTGKNTKIESNTNTKQPATPIYALNIDLNDGKKLDLSAFKDKKILLVNTASDCGYTGQYSDLQRLYEQYDNTLVIVGFPANDFKEQEKGTDAEIASFCQKNFGVTFPLAKKSSVIKGAQQNEVFKWLTDPQKNGWNEKAPTWNFSKYLINEKGVLTNYFDPSVSPLSPEVINAIEDGKSQK